MLAVVLGIAAFGWVGLYFALVAEIGGTRSAGLLTGLALPRLQPLVQRDPMVDGAAATT